MGPDQSVFADVLQLAAICLVPVVIVKLLLSGERLLEGSRAVGRRLGLLRPPPAVVSARPFDRVAADVRRLARDVDTLAPGTPQLKAAATVMAYDDALVEACTALGLPEHLAAARRRGLVTEERRRIEVALEQAGLTIRPSRAA